MRSSFPWLGLAVASLAVQPALAQKPHAGSHAALPELVVSAPFPKTPAEAAQPLAALSGEALRKDAAASLGETLAAQLGVHSASFGPGVGLPIIRGQSGNRVQVLQNSTWVSDASTVSPDHANSLDPHLAERIEVIRGPATLLYGSGAIGGVVNVLDGRVPSRTFESPELLLEQSRASAGDEDKTIAKLDFSLGRLSVHLDHLSRKNDLLEIPGDSFDASLMASHEEEEHEEGEGGDEDGHDEEEMPFSSRGHIANSDATARGGSGGVSLVGERGYIGVAFNQLEASYGLPPGTHDHAHEHEGEEGQGEGEEGHDHEGEDPLAVRLDQETSRHELAAQLDFPDAWVESIALRYSFTDYQHQELEIEGDEALVGTLYDREGHETRLTLRHSPLGAWQGVIGVQASSSDFSALGAEAFIPETKEEASALFLVERWEAGRLALELGARVEDASRDPGSGCGRDERPVSLSASLLLDVTGSDKLLLALADSERAPTTEELYSNVAPGSCAPLPEEDQVAHAATGLLEVGDPQLGKETAQSLELGWRRHTGSWTAEVNAYHKRIADYIYLSEVEEGHAAYLAEDAVFQGLEARLAFPIPTPFLPGETRLEFSADLVEAEFDSGDFLPRTPPARAGLRLAHLAERWTLELSVQEVLKQSDRAPEETQTGGYTRLGLYADYHLPLGRRAEAQFFLKGSNLLDEEIRHHTSLLKAFAPEAGLSWKLGLRLVH